MAASACEPGSDEYYEIFETAVRMYPMDEIANMNAANSAMSSGDYNKASQYLERAGNSDHAKLLREILAKNIEARNNPKTYTAVTFL